MTTKYRIAVRECDCGHVLLPNGEGDIQGYRWLGVSGIQYCFSGFISDEAGKRVLERMQAVPIALVLGKREGDSVTVSHLQDGVESTVTLVLDQFGLGGTMPFEDALWTQTASFGGLYETMTSAQPSRRQQMFATIAANLEQTHRLGRKLRPWTQFRYADAVAPYIE